MNEARTTQTSPKAPRPMTLTSSKSSRDNRSLFSAVATGLTVKQNIYMNGEAQGVCVHL